jgi:hypothetical protein
MFMFELGVILITPSFPSIAPIPHWYDNPLAREEVVMSFPY